MAKRLAEVDTTIKLPPAVLAAAARAQAVHEAAYNTTPVVDALVEPPVVEPPAPIEATTPAPAPAPAPPLAPAPIPVPDETSWEHKYNSMKGRFEREQNTNRQLSDRLNGLESTVAAMSTAAPLPTVTPQSKSLVTEKEVTDYGAEFLDVVGRRAEERFSPKVEELAEQVKTLSDRLQSVGAQTAQSERSRMQAYLNQECPDWTIINNNEKFLDWLALPDTYSGAIRHRLLETAYAANDAPRVLAFFNGFLAEEAAVAPRPDAPVLQVAPVTPKVPLASLAAPGRAKTTATSQVPVEKPSFTRAQITRFYADVASRKYAGRDEEKLRLEQQIHEAGREGRIT